MTSTMKRPSISTILVFAMSLIVLLLIGFIFLWRVKLNMFSRNAASLCDHTTSYYSLLGNDNLTNLRHSEITSTQQNVIFSNKVSSHGNFVKSTNAREEFIRPVKVFPVASNLDGERKSPGDLNAYFHSGNFRRSKAKIWDPHPEYEFNAFGKLFHLVLQHDSGFVHPALKVTTMSKNFSVQQEPDVNPSGCYYSGFLQNEPSSNVVVSLCNGMTGHINCENDSYFIEPAEPFDENVDIFLHFFYRFDSQYSEHETQCEVVENEEHTPFSDDNTFDLTHEDGDVVKNETEVIRSPSRNKRSMETVENVVELMIAADENMAVYHRSGLHNYILTLMSMVAKIYKDSSIGNPININVVKLVVLSEHDIVNVRSAKEETALSETLDSFCRWQQKQNNNNERSRAHHDCAILLSREISCILKDTNKCYDKLGLAQLGTMCQKNCCAIIRDTGLNTAYTIAHELGHVFSMPHDEDKKCKRFIEKGSKKRVMSSQLGRDTHPWKWSACSRHFITEFLDTGNDGCLRDDQSSDFLDNSDVDDELAGEKYSRDKQCELIYGTGYKTCSHLNNCSSLWCTIDGKNESGCHSNGMPLAEGTPCGINRWCQQGDCVLVDRTALKPIDGGWGPWQPYGECSRSCGGGIKRSYRDCDAPLPKNGGKFCLGKRVRYQSCNFKECPYGILDFRSQQCAMFDHNNFEIPGLSKNVRWVAHYYGVNEDNNEKCKLYCKAENKTHPFKLQEKVIDGTPCGPNTYDMCVNGVCMRAGCDHILNSSSVLDTCGICGGNNTTCRQVYKDFNISRAKFGYNRIMIIPAGASNIDIQQRGFDYKKDDNYLALIDAETDKYLLNGNFSIVRYPREIEYDGIILNYSGSNSVIERVNTSRPLRKGLILEVLSVGNLSPPDVVCHYTVPTSPEEYFKWDITDRWTACNKVCRGEQERITRCVRKDTNNYVPDESCSGLFKPTTQIKHCNQHCDLRWDIVSQSECSSFCGPGFRILSYRCFQEFVDQLFARVELPDITCSHIDRPSENQTCIGPCDTHRWKYSEWQPCNVTCGNGIQTREALCVDEFEHVVDGSKCAAAEKITQKRCVMEKCTFWSTSEWSSCSVTCGVGEKVRQARCQQGNKIVPLSMCSADTKPAIVESCQTTLCANWVTGEWSDCSVTCGVGEKTRLVSCSAHDESTCQNSLKPFAVEICSISSCTTASTITNATSVTISIFSSFSSSVSNAITTQTNEIEAAGNAIFEWISGNWTSCSVGCGEGSRRRTLTCYNTKSKTPVEDHKCDASKMPSRQETCFRMSCGEWKITEWSSCSVTCGVGISVRNVWCETKTLQVSEENCVQPKPTNKVICDTSKHCLSSDQDLNSSTISSVLSLGGWRTGRWGECSKLCGGGIMIRHVICQDEHGDETSNCDPTLKPAVSVACNIDPCSASYRWKYGEWSECSVTCGVGFQKRALKCLKILELGGKNEIVSQDFCNGTLRPSTQRECTLNFCANDYIWVPEVWSECNAPCGRKGKQKRKLSCFHRSGRKTKKSFCKFKRKPSRRKKCISNKCEPTNCLEIKKQLKMTEDREYSLNILGRNISIFCYQMWSDFPLEYLTLPAGEDDNFSEFFGKRLIKPDSCPTSRRSKHYCPCIEESGIRSGKTAFSKIRLNLTSLEVMTKDFTFAKQIIGLAIPFGEAGDCYSTANCPQGSFTINLKGTGLRISPTTSWVKDGTNASMSVGLFNENRRVLGKCGGYCATCRPLSGLKLDVLPP